MGRRKIVRNQFGSKAVAKPAAAFFVAGPRFELFDYIRSAEPKPPNCAHKTGKPRPTRQLSKSSLFENKHGLISEGSCQ